MIERLSTLAELPVSQIQITARLRDVRPDGVATLVDAIRNNGFVGRISVRRTKTGDFVMDGAHRLTAARELGMETIPCDVVRCSDDEARMFELDGNLAGAKLTALELSYFLARRRETAHRLFPETGHGGDRGNQHTGGRQTDTMSVCQTVAIERGISERHVYRLMGAGSKLSSDEYRRLNAAPKPIGLNDLVALSKIGSADERTHVVDCLAEGRAKNAAAARKEWAAKQGNAPTIISPTDKAFLRLLDAWKRAPKAAQRRFLDERGDELRALLDTPTAAETAHVLTFRREGTHD